MKAVTERSTTSAVLLGGHGAEDQFKNNYICGQRNVGYGAMMKQQSANKNTCSRSYRGNSGQSLIEYLLLLPCSFF